MLGELMFETREGTISDLRETADNGHAADIRIVSYNTVDTYGTKFSPGSFAPSLAGGSIPAVWQHRADRVIGVVSGFRDNQTCLDGTLEFLDFDAVPDARMAYEAMKKGAIKGISFGFDRLADEPDPDNRGVSIITSADMIEASPVLKAAVPGSKVLSVRSTTRAQAMQLLNEVSDGTITAQEALTLLAEIRSSDEDPIQIEVRMAEEPLPNWNPTAPDIYERY